MNAWRWMKLKVPALIAAALWASMANLVAAQQEKTPSLPVKVGDEITIAADGPGKNSRGSLAVAAGTDNFLCVWREGWEGKNGGARVRATRVRVDGQLLDANAIDVAPNADRDSPQEHPRVAFCRNTFLVVWHDLRNGADYDVLAARISATSGKLLDAAPLKIAVGPHNQVLPDVAADENGFLVVWQGFDPAKRTFRGFAARVGIDGELATKHELDVSPNLRVAWNGTHFLAAGGSVGPQDSGFAQRLNRDGQPLPKAEPIRISTRISEYSLSAVPGHGWLVVSHRSKPDPWGWGGPGAIRSYFLDSNGSLDSSMPKEEGSPRYELQPNWLDYATRDREQWPYGQSASAWDGRRMVVVWNRFHCTGEKKSTLSNADVLLTFTDRWQRQTDTPLAIANSDADELNPDLAATSAGHMLCVYEKEIGPKVILCAKTLRSE